jgi:hypothetical protein
MIHIPGGSLLPVLSSQFLANAIEGGLTHIQYMRLTAIWLLSVQIATPVAYYHADHISCSTANTS